MASAKGQLRLAALTFAFGLNASITEQHGEEHDEPAKADEGGGNGNGGDPVGHQTPLQTATDTG